MTSKKSTGKLEIDVQKLRDEGNWKKLIELTEGGKIGINGKLSFQTSLHLIKLMILLDMLQINWVIFYLEKPNWSNI